MEKLARLAKLSYEDAKKLKNDIDEMIKIAENLKEVELINQIEEKIGFIREDKVKYSLERDEIIENAPEVEGEYIKVPKVVG